MGISVVIVPMAPSLRATFGTNLTFSLWRIIRSLTSDAVAPIQRSSARSYSRTARKRRELPITATELNAIAAPAMTGLSSNPNEG